jgi:aquaporin Z
VRTTNSVRRHWPEYLIEGWALGMFMLSAAVVTVLVETPGGWLATRLDDATLRRALIGLAMGLTAVALIYSPWGQRSGAHMNPAVTLAFWRLGKVRGIDALAYVIAQFAGGALGLFAAAALLGQALAAPPVSWVVTVPGAAGPGVAFAAEAAISALLMLVVLVASNRPALAPWTGGSAGVLVALYITFEAPLSGMSMNPARSFASALPAATWTHLWIYFVAPVAGMLAAASVYAAMAGRDGVHCGKLLHPADQRCIHCGYEPAAPAAAATMTTGGRDHVS